MTIRVGTMMQDSKLPLTTLFWTVYAHTDGNHVMMVQESGTLRAVVSNICTVRTGGYHESAQDFRNSAGTTGCGDDNLI